MMVVPKRRHNHIAKPIMEVMNDTYRLILGITEDPVKGTHNATQTRYDLIVKAQQCLSKIEKPLWVYWNICGDNDENMMHNQSIKQRRNLCDRYNYILKLLHVAQVGSNKYNQDADLGEIKIQYYTEEEIRNAEFLCKLRELHRFTHGKVIRMTNIFKDAEAEILIELIDDAWYCAVHGNQKRLDIEKEREDRRKLFSRAISDLYKFERPLFSVFSLGNYSNREMKDWIDLHVETLRLLQAVQQSDKERA